MSGYNNGIRFVCPICLRTDRKLKAIPTTLSDYHDELADYTLPLEDLYFCRDCECLLRKAYNFKQKCISAAKLLKIWTKATQKELTPAVQLHQKMPPICLDRSYVNSKILNYVYADNIEHSTANQENVSEMLDRDVLKKLNMMDKLDSKGIKYEDIESVVIVKKESKDAQQITTEDTQNLPQNIPTHSSDNTVPTVRHCGIHIIEDRKIKLPQKKRIKKANLENNISINQTESQSTAQKPYKELDNIQIHTNMDNKSEVNDTDLDMICLDDEISDDVIPKNENKSVTDYYNGLGPKERLIEVLRLRGDLETEDGHVFDKEMIISSLDKFSNRVLERLICLFRVKSRLHPQAIKLLTMIQEKQHFTPYESVFNIEYLVTQKDKLEEFERRKTYECYVNSKFKCEICYQGFKAEKNLEYHKKVHNDPQRSKYTCPICQMRLYRRKHHNHNVVFKCKLCPLVTYHSGSMRNHYAQHKGAVYKCDKCDKIFKSKSVHLNHQRVVHPSNDCVCTLCGYAFVSQQGLYSHMLLKHRGASPVPASGPSYKCDKCTLLFSSEAARVTHQKQTHVERGIPQPRKYPALRKKPVLTCPECKTTGGSYRWLVKHYKVEHPTLDVKKIYAARPKPIYLCDICGKIFNNVTYFTEHINIHSGVKIPCPVCNKKFDKAEYLKLHEARHYPPRHCCKDCGKMFHTPANLFAHRRSHIGDRRYKCHICAKGFIHSTSLKEHIRGVHYHERRAKKQGVSRKRRVMDTVFGVTETSNGAADTSVDVSDSEAYVILEVGAEEIIT